MSDEYDLIRQNPDIKEMARKLNKFKAEIEDIQLQISSGVFTDQLDDTRTAKEKIGRERGISPVVASSSSSAPHSDNHDSDGLDPLDLDALQFEAGASPAEAPRMIFWNDDDDTLNIVTLSGQVIQVGQEQGPQVVNKTGVQIDDGKVVYISGADVATDKPTIVLADASTWEDSQLTIGLATVDIADDGIGPVTTSGLVRGVNTLGMVAGDRLYLSETVGEYTNVRPTSPAFIIEVGQVMKVGETDGIVLVKVTNTDDFGFFNGTFIESFDLTVDEVGGNIVASLQRQGGGNLTMRFGDGPYSTLVTPPMTKNLTPGTATVPLANYLYILQSDQTQMALSTSGYPTNVAIIRVAKVVVMTAAIVATDGAVSNQNVNDHAADTILMGHGTHLGDWIRAQPTTWDSGVVGNSSTGDDYLEIEASPDAIYFRSTAGAIRQLHLQTYPVKDTGSIDGGGSDWVYVVNDPDAAYTKVTELIAGIDKLSTGAAWTNNKWVGLVFFGIQSKTGEVSQLLCLLPDGQYNNQSGAEIDINGYTNFGIPDEYRSTGFLICKLVVQKSGTTWSYGSTLDLRSPNPLVAVGGAGGAAIVEFPTNTFRWFDAIDPTKEVDVDASAIAAGNTRTIAFLDEDMELLTAAEKAALHAIFTPAGVAAHTDVTNAGSGIIISAAERTALHPVVVSEDLDHDDLANIDGADIQHITAAQEAALHARYTAAEAIAAADLLNLDSIASHIEHYVAAAIHGHQGNSTLETVVHVGVYTANTGGTTLYFLLTPPSWLVRYCAENGKTLTGTTLTIHWNNVVSADYINTLTLFHPEYDSATTTTVDTDGTNLGSGSTGMRSDVWNHADRAIPEGDILLLAVLVQQGTANSCRIRGVSVTFTIT